MMRALALQAMFNWQLVKSFIKHRIQAKTRHGVHSPFVYRLIDQVIYDFSPRSLYQDIEELRVALLKDDREITVTDLGAGSHVNNNRSKQIKQIAKNALKPAALAKLIHRIAADCEPETIIELGTCLGITTSYLAKATSGGKVISIEGCPQTAAVARENVASLGLNNVEILTGNFDEVFPRVLGKQLKVDFLFIDGNHRKQATLDYFNMALPLVHERSVLIFDDIYWSKGMEEAWEEIKSHPQVSVSVDLFWIGLVFFRPGQAKEHFKVKF